MTRLTEPRSFRLDPRTAADLTYLALLRHQSEGAMVRELIQQKAQEVWAIAVARSPALAQDATLIHNGGTILSREEQDAWHTLDTRVMATPEERRGRPAAERLPRATYGAKPSFISANRRCAKCWRIPKVPSGSMPCVNGRQIWAGLPTKSE